MSGERRYSDDESAAILARAAELSALPSASPGKRGMSLEELERIAQEAGLDPALVKRAAADVDAGAAAPGGASGSAGPPSIWRTVFGPLRVVYETEIEGELDERGRERVSEMLHAATGEALRVSSVGRVLTFTVANGRRNAQILIASRDGRTRIQVQEGLGNIAGGIYGGVGGGSSSLVVAAAIGAATAAGPLAAIGAGLATAAAIFGGSRLIYGAVAAARSAQLERLFELTREAVEQSAERAALERPAGAVVAGVGDGLEGARERLGLGPAPDRQPAEVAAEVGQEMPAGLGRRRG